MPVPRVPPLQEVADAFVEKAIQRRTDDNVVVAVVDLMGEEGWAEMSKKKLFGLF